MPPPAETTTLQRRGVPVNVDSILVSEYAKAEKGNLTVVDAFRHLTAPQLPARLPLFAVSLVIHGSESEASTKHVVEIHLINQRREPLRKPLRQEFEFPPGPPPPGMPLRTTVAHRFHGQEFPEEGTYAVEVYIDGTYHASATFHIAVKQA